MAVSALAQLSWAVIGRLELDHRGIPVSSLGPRAGQFWPAVAALQVRAGLVVVVSALLAFGLAQLLRNSAAAFGVGFLYFAVIETAVRVIHVQWSPYLLTQAIAAWTTRGGVDVYLHDRLDRRTGLSGRRGRPRRRRVPPSRHHLTHHRRHPAGAFAPPVRLAMLILVGHDHRRSHPNSARPHAGR